ncbi:hypothetical protein [Amycolatopsis lexingtonensis]|uniref:hypothetical protein n=1 Tax=Amycolatopsis lexingtonensis TaxID=218822 RepID=UPI003F6F6294
MGWYVARSLDRLLAQLNAKAPQRSKASDGSIGDAAHSARLSDHNPTSAGQVCARDYTHDPAGGLDCNWLADALVRSRDPRIKYVIWNRRIIDSRPGNHPWVWMPYSGTNPHNKHLHLSVFAGSAGDNTADWALSGAPSGGGGSTPPPAPNPTPSPHKEDEDEDEMSFYPKLQAANPNIQYDNTLPWDGREATLHIIATGSPVFMGKPLCWGAGSGLNVGNGLGGGESRVAGVNPSRVEVNQPGAYRIPAGTTRVYYTYSCATNHYALIKAV